MNVRAALVAAVVVASLAGTAQAISYRVVDLTPDGMGGIAGGVADGQQVGATNQWDIYGAPYHASLWAGSAASYVNLNPIGFTESWASSVANGQQVGSGRGAATGGDSVYHALLWTGSADSYVDLHPAGFAQSWASDVADGQQVGFALATDGTRHALQWSGSADSYVDLTPSGFTESRGAATARGQQVGWAMGPTTGVHGHAMLWTGSADSYVDLNPADFDSSFASAVADGQQVGSGWGETTTGGADHALLWTGSAASYVDLNAFLPPGFGYGETLAGTIDAAGNIVGRTADATGRWHAVMWVPVPEPTTLILLLLGGMVLARHCRR